MRLSRPSESSVLGFARSNGLASMKLATFNLNGIRARLPRLLEWLEREKPDIACLQELKCADESLPIARHRGGGLWRGVARPEGLQRGRDPGPRQEPGSAPVGPSRRPRRQPQPLYRGGGRRPDRRAPSTSPTAIRSGPRSSTTSCAGWSGCARMPPSCSRSSGRWCWPAISTSCPRTATSFRPRRPSTTPCSSPRPAPQWRRIVAQGWTDALRAFHPTDDKLYTFWDYTAGCWQRDAGFRIDHLLCSPEAADRLAGAGRRQMGAGRGKGLRSRADLGRAR